MECCGSTPYNRTKEIGPGLLADMLRDLSIDRRISDAIRLSMQSYT